MVYALFYKFTLVFCKFLQYWFFAVRGRACYAMQNDSCNANKHKLYFNFSNIWVKYCANKWEQKLISLFFVFAKKFECIFLLTHMSSDTNSLSQVKQSHRCWLLHMYFGQKTTCKIRTGTDLANYMKNYNWMLAELISWVSVFWNSRILSKTFQSNFYIGRLLLLQHATN